MDLAPLILTAELSEGLFHPLDRLRQTHFPTGRNFLAAHVTLFHHLPGAQLQAVDDVVRRATMHRSPIEASIGDPRSTGRGVSVELVAPQLTQLRGELAMQFEPWLTPQDRQGYRPHVTVQNKVDPAVARRTLIEVRDNWRRLTGSVTGLLLWHYRGGPWEPAGRFGFEAG